MHGALELARLVARRERSPEEIVLEAIGRIEAGNPGLNAVIHPRFERALEEARAWPMGPLAGVPILMKDTGATLAGEPWHEGLRVARDARHVATTTAYLTRRLQAAGCIILGRTNVPELCTHVTTEPLAYAATRNPWNPEYSAGGSSGGSGAAVGAGMVPIAHGTDGGGSVRAPAALCGVLGLKPSRGRISAGPLFGEVWAGLSTDGFLAWNARDLAAVFDAVAGPAAGDPNPAPRARPTSEALGRVLPPLRIGLRTRGACGGDAAHPEVDARVREAARRFEDAGHRVEESSPAGLDEDGPVAWQGLVVSVCLAGELAAWSRRIGRPIGLEELEPRNRSAIEAGRSVSGQAFLEAREALFAWSRRLADWFEGFDLLVTPVLTQPGIRIGELPTEPDPEAQAAMRRRLGWLTPPWNVTGQPAISVPAGRTSTGLPVGLQLVARPGREDLLLAVAEWLERASPWPRAATETTSASGASLPA